jgi:hypothetical protein
LRAYERSCSHTIHVLMGGLARSNKFSAFCPMIMNAWKTQGMNPSRWLNQDCSTTVSAQGKYPTSSGGAHIYQTMWSVLTETFHPWPGSFIPDDWSSMNPVGYISSGCEISFL